MPLNNDIELRSEEVQEVMNRIPPTIHRWGITVMALIVVIFFAIAYFVKIPVMQECSFTISPGSGEGQPSASIIIPATAIQSIISNDSTEVRLYSDLFPSGYRNGIAVVVYPSDIQSRPDNSFGAAVQLPDDAERAFRNVRLTITGTANIVASYKTLLERFSSNFP